MPTGTADQGFVDLPLIPPARLAVLLAAKRRESGLDLADLACSSNQRFSPTLLEQIEKGQVHLDNATISDVAKVYGLQPGASLPHRSKLVLDLNAQHLAVGDTMLPFKTSTTDAVLERYVSLLYLLRDEQPGRVLPLRDDDLDVLGSTLDLSVGRLRGDLRSIMDAASPSQQMSWLSRHLSLAAAGLLVGVTTAGSLIMLDIPGGGYVVSEPAVDGAPVPTAVVASHEGLHRGAPDSDAAVATLSASTTASTAGAAAMPEATLIRSEQDSAPAASSHEGDNYRPPEPEASTTSKRADGAAEADNPIGGASNTTAAAPVIEEVSGAAIDLAAIETHVGRDLTSLVPGWTIEIHGDIANYRGLTNRAERTIAVYVDHDATVGSVAEVLAHEIGHAIDLDRLDTEARLQWVEMRGMPTVWWAGNGLSDFAVGAGDFAEGVAAHLVGSPSHSVYGDFSAEQLAFVAQFIG